MKNTKRNDSESNDPSNEQDSSFYYESSLNSPPDSTDLPTYVYTEDDVINMSSTKWE